MNLSRDVIADLWLVYTSGEASEDTQEIVEDFLATDPEFAMILKQERSSQMLDTPALPSADQEMRALNATRKRLRSQTHPDGICHLLQPGALVVLR